MNEPLRAELAGALVASRSVQALRPCCAAGLVYQAAPDIARALHARQPVVAGAARAAGCLWDAALGRLADDVLHLVA